MQISQKPSPEKWKNLQKQGEQALPNAALHYIIEKMIEDKAVIALTEDNTWVGFCYIEEWSHGEFVANSGLIVAPAFQKNRYCQTN